jgi:hypothetical protein
MTQTSLLQQLEEVADKIRSLEREKGEAVAKMKALELEKNEAVGKTRVLEREVSEMAAIITQAGDKVEEMLKIGANDEISQPPAVNVPKESKGQKQLGEFSADPKRGLKEHSVMPRRSD